MPNAVRNMTISDYGEQTRRRRVIRKGGATIDTVAVVRGLNITGDSSCLAGVRLVGGSGGGGG